MIAPDRILTPVYQRLANDATLQSLAKTFVKGADRGDKFENPSATCFVLTHVQPDPEIPVWYSTVVITVYAENDPDGRPNLALLATITERVVSLFDKKPIEGAGFHNFHFDIEEVTDARRSPVNDRESYSSCRFSVVMRRD